MFGTYPWAEVKGWAVITKELCPEPGMGGVAEAGRDVEELTERTVWKTRFWEILQDQRWETRYMRWEDYWKKDQTLM